MFIPAAFIVPHPPMIVPQVGRGAEATVQVTVDSYHEIARRVAEIAPQTIVVISLHAVTYSDYIHVAPGSGAAGSLQQFGAPQQYSVEYDTALVEQLSHICDAEGFPAGTLGERDPALDHGTLVPLHFISQYYTDYRLVRCSISGLSRIQHYRFGMLLCQAIEALGRSTVIVASGDLSHRLAASGPYGFTPEGPQLDACLTDIMRGGNFGGFFALDEVLCERGAECGLRSFIIMAGALDGLAVEPRFYSYEGTSGVGYAVCEFFVAGLAPGRDFLAREQESSRSRIAALREQESIWVCIAREALESYLEHGQLPPLPEGLPAELTKQRAGVFVSLKKQGQLRGCIGTTEPTADSVAQEIRQNVLSAALRDPRFEPVTAAELPQLVYSVDVLSAAEPCDKSGLDVQRYGVIVSSGTVLEAGDLHNKARSSKPARAAIKRGLLLPDLAGVDTVEQQIEIACQKAGIGPQEQYTLERFEVTRYK